MFNLLATLAKFERDIIRDCTKAGLTLARARRHQGGRAAVLSKQVISKTQATRILHLEQEKP